MSVQSQQVTELLDAAFDNPVDVQLTRDRQGINMLLRVARYDAGGSHEQLAVGPQPVDHGIGQRHTQVIVLRVWSQKLEGQHGYSALARDSDWQDSFGCRGLIRPFPARGQAVATARPRFSKTTLLPCVPPPLPQPF